MRRLQLQLVFVLLAAISVAALSAILIVRSIRGAERVVVGDTRRVVRVRSRIPSRVSRPRMVWLSADCDT